MSRQGLSGLVTGRRTEKPLTKKQRDKRLLIYEERKKHQAYNTPEEKKAKELAASKAWYSANRKRVSEREKANRAANPKTEEEKEKMREYHRARRAAIRKANGIPDQILKTEEEKKEDKRRWGRARRARIGIPVRVKLPPEELKRRIAERKKAYHVAHPEIRKSHKHRRRAAKAKTNKNRLTAKQIKVVLSCSKHCHWCKKPWTKTRKPTLDHVIPLAKDGAHSLDNIVAACRHCNCLKNDRLINPVTGQGILL